MSLSVLLCPLTRRSLLLASSPHSPQRHLRTIALAATSTSTSTSTSITPITSSSRASSPGYSVRRLSTSPPLHLRRVRSNSLPSSSTPLLARPIVIVPSRRFASPPSSSFTPSESEGNNDSESVQSWSLRPPIQFVMYGEDPEPKSSSSSSSMPSHHSIRPSPDPVPLPADDLPGTGPRPPREPSPPVPPIVHASDPFPEPSFASSHSDAPAEQWGSSRAWQDREKSIDQGVSDDFAQEADGKAGFGGGNDLRDYVWLGPEGESLKEAERRILSSTDSPSSKGGKHNVGDDAAGKPLLTQAKEYVRDGVAKAKHVLEAATMSSDKLPAMQVTEPMKTSGIAGIGVMSALTSATATDIGECVRYVLQGAAHQIKEMSAEVKDRMASSSSSSRLGMSSLSMAQQDDESVVEKVKQAANQVTDKAKEGFDKAREIAKKGMEKAKEVKDKVAEKADEMKSSTGSTGKQVKEAGEEVADKARDMANKGMKKAKEVANSPTGQQVKRAGEATWEKAKEGAEKVGDMAKRGMDRAGVTRDAAEQTERGASKVQEVTQRAAEKIRQGADKVKEMAENAKTKMVATDMDTASMDSAQVLEMHANAQADAEAGLAKVRHVASESIESVKQKVAQGVEKVKEGAKKVSEKAGEVKEKVMDKASEGVKSAKKAGEKVSEKAAEVKDKVSEKATELKEKVTEKADEAKDKVAQSPTAQRAAQKARQGAEKVSDMAQDAKRAAKSNMAAAGAGMGASSVTMSVVQQPGDLEAKAASEGTQTMKEVAEASVKAVLDAAKTVGSVVKGAVQGATAAAKRASSDNDTEKVQGMTGNLQPEQVELLAKGTPADRHVVEAAVRTASIINTDIRARDTKGTAEYVDAWLADEEAKNGVRLTPGSSTTSSKRIIDDSDDEAQAAEARARASVLPGQASTATPVGGFTTRV